MAEGAALARLTVPGGLVTKAGAAAADGFRISLSHNIADVEPIWRKLTATAIDSPGQSFDFVRLWVDALRVPEADQFYVVAELDGQPLALMPLQRRWGKGVRILSWFPGPHVGCNAPVVDLSRLVALTPHQRRTLWIAMLRGSQGADLVYLKALPQLLVDGVDVFAELGQSLEAGILYRADFPSFEEADRTQRNKSRRKHDRQQGEKLEALGALSFETLTNGPAALELLDVMFRQRAARFREMGVFNPFEIPAIRAFYDATARSGSGVPIQMHALKLDGATIAVRYSVAHADRLFCLISSMSEDAALRPGSPGKQCLLRVMQAMHTEGFHVFDMGEGFTDEKRHWCNMQIPVRNHYVPITRRGAVAASAHRGLQTAKQRIKSDPRLLELAKRARGLILRVTGRSAPEAPRREAE